MEKKVFNDRGFLTQEGKAFINDNFMKAMRQVMATATNANDAQIIGSILRSLIGEEASNMVLAFQVKTNAANKIPNNVIPFRKLIKKTTSIQSLLKPPLNPD